jgi:hypothetical protein
MFLRSQYFYHLVQYRHHELLQQDCLSEELKINLKIKANYHNSKVVELGSIRQRAAPGRFWNSLYIVFFKFGVFCRM